MAKPEWGLKHICPDCGRRFYDLGRDPAVCPGCGAAFSRFVTQRPRRGRAAAAQETRSSMGVAAASEDEEMLEDASELDEDGDEVSDDDVEDDR